MFRISFRDLIVEYFPHPVKKRLQKGAFMFEKIKQFCEERSVTIEQFERIIGVSAGYTYKLKNHTPSVKIAKKIAVLLEMSLEDLFEANE